MGLCLLVMLHGSSMKSKVRELCFCAISTFASFYILMTEVKMCLIANRAEAVHLTHGVAAHKTQKQEQGKVEFVLDLEA